MPRAKKEKVVKVKLDPKMCMGCGNSSSEYIIYMNGAFCKECQNDRKLDKIKELTT